MISDLAAKVSDLVKGEGPTGSVVDLMTSPEQRAILDRVTAVMSLLEATPTS